MMWVVVGIFYIFEQLSETRVNRKEITTVPVPVKVKTKGFTN